MLCLRVIIEKRIRDLKRIYYLDICYIWMIHSSKTESLIIILRYYLEGSNMNTPKIYQK